MTGPRKRSTRQSTQAKSYVFSSGSESDGDDVQTVSRPAQACKKRKTTHNSDADATAKKKGKGRSRNLGKLQALLDMPLDIVAEITSYLLPLDMLHLSRVSEHFRQLFSPYKNKQAWVSARHNVPALPDCPEDLNEGKYASLMFEHHCQECDASRANLEDYSLYIRLCKRCHNKRVTKGTVILRNLGEKYQKAPEGIWRLFPRSSPYRRYRGIRVEQLHNDKYLQDEFESLATRYLKLLRAPTADSDAELAKRRDAVEKRHAFANAAAEWRRVVVVDNENVEKKRAEDIINRLRKDHGWTPEMFSLMQYEHKYHTLLNQPRPLTERIFKTVKKEVDGLLLKRHIDKRRTEFEELIHEIIGPELSPVEFPRFPSAHKMALLPAAVDLFEENDAIAPITGERIRGIIRDLVPQILPLSLDVRRGLLAELDREVFPAYRWAAVKEISDDDVKRRQANGDLRRARFVFSCSQSTPTYTPYNITMREGPCQGRCVNFDEYPSHSRLSKHSLSLHGDSCKHAALLLERLGLPRDALVEDTKQFDGRLKCSCNHPEMKHRGLGFYEMVQHLQPSFDDRKVPMFMDFTATGTTYSFISNIHDEPTIGNTIEVLPEPLNDPNPQAADAPADGFNPNLSQLPQCKACSELTNGRVRVKFPSPEHIEYHMRTRHRIEGDNFDEHLI